MPFGKQKATLYQSMAPGEVVQRNTFFGNAGAAPTNTAATPFTGRNLASITRVSAGIYRLTFTGGFYEIVGEHANVSAAAAGDWTAVVRNASKANKTVDVECRLIGVLTDLGTTDRCFVEIVFAESAQTTLYAS